MVAEADVWGVPEQRRGRSGIEGAATNSRAARGRQIATAQMSEPRAICQRSLLLEEDPVVLTSNLGEVAHARLRRIGHEPEAIPGRPRRAGTSRAGGVVAITSIVARSSKYSPRNASTQSEWDRRTVVPRHSIRSELMTACTLPIGWKVLSEFGTVNASKTSTFFTWSDASSSRKSTSTLPSGISVVHTTSLSLTPGSYECGPNGLAPGAVGFGTSRLSSHMKANAPRWTRPSVPTNFPAMNRMSVWNPYRALAPVVVSVPVPAKMRSACPTTPSKLKISEGSRPAA